MSPGHSVLAVPLAIGAAASFAVANVAQREAVKHQPGGPGNGARLLVRAIREPLWLGGLMASLLGFSLEALALSIAPIVLVQPLIVAELPFALPLAAFVNKSRLGRREWGGLGLVTAGLLVLVSVIRPTDSSTAASPAVWLTLFAVVGAGVAVMLRLGGRASGVSRTSAMAIAAGTTFGLLAVVTKATTHQFSAHGLGALLTWQPWALATVGLVGLTLAQTAYRAGPLAVSLPLIDVGEPLVASGIAVFAFGERLGPLGLASSTAFLLAVAMVGLGVAVLDRSPLVQAAQAASARPARDPTAI
jgi:drug/metabolite transporter (DMT)-like permease